MFINPNTLVDTRRVFLLKSGACPTLMITGDGMFPELEY
jgi:hypothetical protein